MAIVLQDLGLLAKYYTPVFTQHFFRAPDPTSTPDVSAEQSPQSVSGKKTFGRLVTHPDPLIRGSVSNLLSCLIAGLIVESKQTGAAQEDKPTISEGDAAMAPTELVVPELIQML